MNAYSLFRLSVVSKHCSAVCCMLGFIYVTSDLNVVLCEKRSFPAISACIGPEHMPKNIYYTLRVEMCEVKE